MGNFGQLKNILVRSSSGRKQFGRLGVRHTKFTFLGVPIRVGTKKLWDIRSVCQRPCHMTLYIGFPTGEYKSKSMQIKIWASELQIQIRNMYMHGSAKQFENHYCNECMYTSLMESALSDLAYTKKSSALTDVYLN